MEKIFEIALVFSGHEWVEAFHRRCTNTGILKIKTLVYDTSALEIEDFDACIIADSHPSLNKAFVHQLHDNNKLVFAIASDDLHSKTYVSEVGADAVFLNSTSPKELISEIHEFLCETKIEESHSQVTDPIEIFLEEDTTEHFNGGLLVGVIGHGGTGSTFLSTQLATRSPDSLLIDLDFDHPSIALNMQSEIAPNLLDALEAVSDREELSSILHHGKHFEFVPGVSHSSFSSNIGMKELTDLIEQSRKEFTNVILDIGRISENSIQSSKITTIIKQCDVVLVTFDPTPLGVLRLLELVAFVSGISSEHAPKAIAIANRHLGNNAIARSISAEIESLESLDSVIFVPNIDNQLLNSWRGKSKTNKKFNASIGQLLLSIEKSKTKSGQIKPDEGYKQDLNLEKLDIKEIA